MAPWFSGFKALREDKMYSFDERLDEFLKNKSKVMAKKHKTFEERVFLACSLLKLPLGEWEMKVSAFTWEGDLATFGRSEFIHWACWETLAIDKLDELINCGAVHEIEARRAISPYNTRRYVEDAGGPEEDHSLFEKGIDYSISKGWVEANYRDRMDLTSCGGWRYPPHRPD
jgi:hypothetical protein